jgi:hypothetical protein
VPASRRVTARYGVGLLVVAVGVGAFFIGRATVPANRGTSPVAGGATSTGSTSLTTVGQTTAQPTTPTTTSPGPFFHDLPAASAGACRSGATADPSARGLCVPNQYITTDPANCRPGSTFNFTYLVCLTPDRRLAVPLG